MKVWPGINRIEVALLSIYSGGLKIKLPIQKTRIRFNLRWVNGLHHNTLHTLPHGIKLTFIKTAIMLTNLYHSSLCNTKDSHYFVSCDHSLLLHCIWSQLLWLWAGHYNLHMLPLFLSTTGAVSTVHWCPAHVSHQLSQFLPWYHTITHQKQNRYCQENSAHLTYSWYTSSNVLGKQVTLA